MARLTYALRYPSRALAVIGIAGGKIVDDRHWSETYHSRLQSREEERGRANFHADPEVNRCGNASWRQYCRRPALLRDLAALDLPCVFINAGEDIRPNWPTQQLAGLIRGSLYIEIPDAPHYIWLTHASELRQELRRAIDHVLHIDKNGTLGL